MIIAESDDSALSFKRASQYGIIIGVSQNYRFNSRRFNHCRQSCIS